ncbi:MAG: PilZ domain-containing protein [Desulfomonile tiedjei]|nr:PilZ domain-containing protein [Desulfomonile tiedjei]
MSPREIRGRDILADVKAGMADAVLMSKYKLTAQALLKVMTRLVWDGFLPASELALRKPLIKSVLQRRQRRIVAKDMLRDLRSRMSDAALMEKYKLTSRGLQRIFERLVDSNAIGHAELQEISSSYRAKVEGISGRRHNRAYLTVPVPIYDSQSFSAGLLRDISREGFRVVGIESAVGDIKTFEIPLDMFGRAEPLLVVGECRWVARRGLDQRYIVAGYKMSNFSRADENAVRKFISSLLFTDSGEWQTVR